MIKIVIPTNDIKGLDDVVADHFGRCQTYTFLNEKGEVIEIIRNTSEHMGGIGTPPELMKQHEANILLCKDLGPKALDLCSQLNILVYVDQSESVREIYKLWKDKKLTKASTEDACQQHK